MADESGFQLQGSAPERYERYAAPFMAPFVGAILEAVDLHPGAAVLDLACGTGFAARAAAARVGPAGRVSGADINPGMIGVAEEHVSGRYPDIEFTVAPAERLPFEDAAFDAVVCQQGVQFFPDLDAALAETARVTRPDGRFAATAWAARELIPYFVAQYEAVGEHGGKELAEDYEGAFSGTPERLSAAMLGAGFHDVAVRRITFDIPLPPLDAYAPGQLSSTSWGQAIARTAGDDALLRAGRAVHTRLAGHTAPDGSAILPFTANLLTGIR
ncbi:class I SAM-dependent methyltransferase [Streptomyces sp. NPDC005244]|uniref:class I SAM-dependent methyltransferase n=1 Tax=Streptomyces sp. NPDC005244 TaxID=3364708 RepID=UPI0036944C10